jgi:lipopolysaccharide/colanic/teichoic acid biosynthesis glycosyltransferase
MTWSIPNIDVLKKQSFQDLLSEAFVQKLFNKKKVYFTLKRLMDCVGSVLALSILSPVFFLLWILIHIDSPGPAFFSHKRIGQNGKLFTIHKFRTMKCDAKDQELAPVEPNDSRITKLGHFLRRTSLDEMPQFWNVLKGDMSLVGPRPEMEFIVKEYTPIQNCRLLIKPGITGVWQVKGRKDLPLHENVECDLYYIINQSFTLDLRILVNTITVVISGKGAY